MYYFKFKRYKKAKIDFDLSSLNLRLMQRFLALLRGVENVWMKEITYYVKSYVAVCIVFHRCYSLDKLSLWFHIFGRAFQPTSGSVLYFRAAFPVQRWLWPWSSWSEELSDWKTLEMWFSKYGRSLSASQRTSEKIKRGYEMFGSRFVFQVLFLCGLFPDVCLKYTSPIASFVTVIYSITDI